MLKIANNNQPTFSNNFKRNVGTKRSSVFSNDSFYQKGCFYKKRIKFIQQTFALLIAGPINQIKLYMKKSGTLPSIKQKEVAANIKSKQTYRRLQSKINTHDQEIVKNQKVIYNLANQFRMLKQKLQFEQQYSQKYKAAVQRYQEEATRLQRLIKEQKGVIGRLELAIKEQVKTIQSKNKQIRAFKEKQQEYQSIIYNHQKSIEECQRTIEANIRNLNQREEQIKVLQNQKQGLKNQLKQKDKQYKNKLQEIRSEYESSSNQKVEKMKNLERQIELLNSFIGNVKQTLAEREIELQKAVINAFNIQQRFNKKQKDEELKFKNYQAQLKLMSQLNEQLKRELAQQQNTIQDLQSTLKSLSAKNSATFGEKMKQFNLQKRDLNDKITQFQSKFDDLAKAKQLQAEQKQRQEKANMQLKNRLADSQAKLQNLAKSKEDIQRQLGKLKANIMCDYCSRIMKKPVTSIPCGHSHCQQCKKGYQLECNKCLGIKRQAVYRNELLDEIIQATNSVEKIICLLAN